MMMMAVLLAVGTTRATAFKAFDCNNGSAPIEQNSLLDPEPCGNMQKVHAVERDLHGEIVQIKKERLVQVTKCIVFETITSTYCGFQSRAGVPRYVKFRTPLTIEPSDCRLSAKLGRIKINGKEHPFEMGVKTDFSVYLVGGLDAQGNCEVGAYEVDGEMLTNQVVLASYEVDIRQEWARTNDLIGTIKLSEALIATTTDRATVDSGEGTYVWDYSQDACPVHWTHQGPDQLHHDFHRRNGHCVRKGQESSGRIGTQGNNGAVRQGCAENAHQEHCGFLPSTGADPSGIWKIQYGD
jgi:hypothetical protein